MDAPLRNWANETAGLPGADKNHKIVQERGTWWCSCGHYLCGKSTADGGTKRDELRKIAREKYDLHRVITRNAGRSPRA